MPVITGIEAIMATGCPCGATPKSEFGLLDYLTDDLIEAAVGSSDKLKKFKGLLIPFVASAIWVDALCGQPRMQMPELFIVDFVNPANGWPKIAQALNSALYPLLCDCLECPPITGCLQGTDCYAITQENGYFTEDGGQKRFHIPGGAELWVQGSNGECLGLKNGLWVYWTIDPPFDGSVVSINVRAGDDFAPGQSWDVETYGAGLTICPTGEQKPSSDPWPTPPPGVADFYGPPSCTTDDICAALEYVYQSIRRTEFLAQVSAGPTYGVTTPYVFTLPGVNTITGTLAETLPRVIEALAPVQPSQLQSPATVPITEPSLVELSGVSYCRIALTTVPPTMGWRGADDALVYHVTGVWPGPGWVVLIGQAGVIRYYDLRYGEGVEFDIPATATALAFQLSAGVEVALTTWERHV